MPKEWVPTHDVQEALSAQEDKDATFAAIDRRHALRLMSGSLLLPLLGVPSWLLADTRVEAIPTPAAQGSGIAEVFASDDPLISVKALLAITGAALSVAAMVSVPVALTGVFLGLVSGLIGIFWPSSGPSADDIWELIKDKVQGLVDSAISDVEFGALQNAITGLQQNLSDYANLQQTHLQLGSAQSLAQLREKYIAVDAFCIGIRPQFLPLGHEARFLPLFVQFANLHHALLQDMVLNGKAYGVEAGITAGDVAKLSQTVAINSVTFDLFWNGIQARFGHGFAQLGGGQAVMHASKVTAPSGNKTYIEDGLYDTVKSAYNTLAQLTVLAKDFRDLWPYMGGLQKGPVALTRELWFGPFGKPDALELPGDYSRISAVDGSATPGAGVWENTYGFAVSAAPAPSPLAPLSDAGFGYLVVNRAPGDVWQFPASLNMQRDEHVAMEHGAIVGVRVDIGHYVSRGVAGSASSIPAAGYLVSQLYFRHEDGTTLTYGSDPTSPAGDGREMKGYYGEDIDVPAGHILSGMYINTRVNNLYRHVGVGGASIGSMMFGFRLEDPNFTPTPASLIALAATHPTSLSADDLLATATAAAQTSGKPLTLEAQTQLRSRFERELASPQFAARRAAFQSRFSSYRKLQ